MEDVEEFFHIFHISLKSTQKPIVKTMKTISLTLYKHNIWQCYSIYL